MRKKIRFYKQHSMETCGPACMLMLLDLYGKIEYPTQKQEMKLYSLYRSKAFKGVNGAAIANCLSKNGLNVHLAHSSVEMMENRSGYFTDELYTALLAEYQTEAAKCEGKIDISTGVGIFSGATIASAWSSSISSRRRSLQACTQSLQIQTPGPAMSRAAGPSRLPQKLQRMGCSVFFAMRWVPPF